MKKKLLILLAFISMLGIGNVKAFTCSYELHSGATNSYKININKVKNTGYLDIKFVTNSSSDALKSDGTTAGYKRYIDINGTSYLIHDTWWDEFYKGIASDDFNTCNSIYVDLSDKMNGDGQYTEHIQLNPNGNNIETAKLNSGAIDSSLKQCEFFSVVSVKTGTTKDGDKTGKFSFNGTVTYDGKTNSVSQICLELNGNHCVTGENEKSIQVDIYGDSVNGNDMWYSEFAVDKLFENGSVFKDGCPDALYYTSNSDDLNHQYSFDFNLTSGEAVILNKHGEAMTILAYQQAAVDPNKDVVDSSEEEKDIDANCESMLGPEITEFINDIFKIIMIAGPVLALVLGTFDLIKALASGEEDAKKKATKKVRGRIIAAVLLFLVPYIVKVLLDLANVAYDKDCPGMQNLYIMLEDLWRI